MNLKTQRIRSAWAALVVALVMGLSTFTVSADRAFTEAELESALVGTWKGEWANMQSSGTGSIVFEITTAQNGTISGTGRSSGGPCAEPLSISGRYKGAKVSLRVLFQTEGCGEVRVTMQGGHLENGDQMLGGAWGHIVDGRSVADAFGILTVTKAAP